MTQKVAHELGKRNERKGAPTFAAQPAIAPWHKKRLVRDAYWWPFTIIAIVLINGCAIHYYDKTTGTEHLWGFGHMKMAVRPPDEGVRAVVKGTQTFGLSIGLGVEDYYLSAGWNNSRKITVADDATVRIDWPSGGFFNVRVGTNLPPRGGDPTRK